MKNYLRAFAGIACLVSATAIQAQTTYDFSNAVIAKNAAGSIGTNVWETTPEGSNWFMLGISKSQAGPGCEFTGCADAAFSLADLTAENGSLRFGLNDLPIGEVQGLTRYGPVTRKAFIYGSGAQNGGLYTELIDPEHTSFSFTFTGHSQNAGQGVNLFFDISSQLNPDVSYFHQNISANEAGDWQLVVNTPMGMGFDGKRISFGLSAASGQNTVSSLLVSANVVAVPEPTSLALTSFGLIFIGVVARRSRLTTDGCTA